MTTDAKPSMPQVVDVELLIKVIRGIADVAAGRCVPVEVVRSRVLARYDTSAQQGTPLNSAQERAFLPSAIGTVNLSSTRLQCDLG